MKAIVYNSNTGLTQKYAKMLSKQTGLPAVKLADAKKTLKKNDEIIFMGWIMGGIIAGLHKAKRYNVKAVGAVGMSLKEDKYTEFLIKTNKLEIPCFYMQGGLDVSKLKGIKAVAIKIVGNLFSKKKDMTEEGKAAAEMFTHANDFTSEENLAEFSDWCKINK